MPENVITHGIWNLENNQAATEVNFSSFLWFSDLKTWIKEEKVLQFAEIFKAKKIIKKFSCIPENNKKIYANFTDDI